MHLSIWNYVSSISQHYYTSPTTLRHHDGRIHSYVGSCSLRNRQWKMARARVRPKKDHIYNIPRDLSTACPKGRPCANHRAIVQPEDHSLRLKMTSQASPSRPTPTGLQARGEALSVSVFENTNEKPDGRADEPSDATQRATHGKGFFATSNARSISAESVNPPPALARPSSTMNPSDTCALFSKECRHVC